MTDMPAWMEELVETVAAVMTAYGPIGPLGLRYGEEAGWWDIFVYPLPLEMIGGAHDGGLAAPNFTLELQGLLSAFARVDGITWSAHGVETDDSPCICVEGLYQGQAIRLRVLAFAPADVGPGLKVDATGRA
jgi:hypothetical protein